MPLQANNDILTAAREFNTIENCGINPQRAHELIDMLADELEQSQQTIRNLERCDMCPRPAERRLCGLHRGA